MLVATTRTITNVAARLELTAMGTVLHAWLGRPVEAATTATKAPLLARDRDGPPLDELMDRLVAVQRTAPPAAVFQRPALRTCPPTVRMRGATSPLAPRTLVTTRLAEHSAHALDITTPLGIAYPDTVRLWHVCWLAHRSLPYAFAVAGKHAAPVRCELLAPGGRTWQFGPADAPACTVGHFGGYAVNSLDNHRPRRRKTPGPAKLITAGQELLSSFSRPRRPWLPHAPRTYSWRRPTSRQPACPW